jgi:hypothetical protein
LDHLLAVEIILGINGYSYMPLRREGNIKTIMTNGSCNKK